MRLARADPGPMSQPPKVLDQARQAIRLRHYSRRSEQAYVAWIRRFIVFHGERHPRELGEEDVTAFVSILAVRGVSASTQNQALSAFPCEDLNPGTDRRAKALANSGARRYMSPIRPTIVCRTTEL